jgi:ATP-dependent DNA helicase RecG
VTLKMAGADDLLNAPLRFLKGVGRKRAEDLSRVGLDRVEDLLFRLPFRYEDRGNFQPIASAKAGQPISVAGELINCGVRLTKRQGFKLFQGVVRDESGLLAVVWPNQPYLANSLRPHRRVVLFGTVERWRGRLQLTSPQFEIVDEDDQETIHTGRIVPVYERAGVVAPKLQRTLVHDVLQRLPDRIEDPLPAELCDRLGLPDRRTALLEAHFPAPGVPIDQLNRFRAPAQVRLIFEEFFLFQLGLALRRRHWQGEAKRFVPAVDDRVRNSARQVLPFRLTPGQRQALKDIVEDMQRSRPMNRLLQGDVGCGKTIVALLAALVAMENDLQVAFMAPTEILAEQHEATIRRLLARSRFRMALLTSAASARARRDVLGCVRRGEIHLLVGTHALVEEGVVFDRLGLVVIDEQHRFGVMQRAALREKGLRPDVLVMTATPIPRTLALTLYGDLDISAIHDMPPGRPKVETRVKSVTERDKVYAFVRGQLDEGRQAYVVYPLVEESDKIDLRAATSMADHLAQDVFPAYRVGLLHGRMNQDAKDGVMRRFAGGEIDVLVATSVVEVGIDVPNASVMVVEHAERFGLAQLHQLRGRVGRDRHPSHCLLLHQTPLSQEAAARLKAISETSDGFVIAERDLAIRGPGDLSGLRQAGMPTLRVGDLQRDYALMQDAWRAASAWIDRDDGAAGRVRAYAERTWASRFGLVGVG